MSLNRWLFLLYLLVISDTLAAFIGGLQFWYLHRGAGNPEQVRPFARRLAIALLAIAWDSCSLLLANQDPPVAHYTRWFAWWYWTGRGIRSAAIWSLVIWSVKARSYK